MGEPSLWSVTVTLGLPPGSGKVDQAAFTGDARAAMARLGEVPGVVAGVVAGVADGCLYVEIDTEAPDSASAVIAPAEVVRPVRGARLRLLSAEVEGVR